MEIAYVLHEISFVEIRYKTKITSFFFQCRYIMCLIKHNVSRGSKTLPPP